MTTPVEQHGEVWAKRDDLFVTYGVSGGKARTCEALSLGAEGLITAGSRHSPQVKIVSHIGRGLGVPVRVHVPAAKGESAEIDAARRAGAEVIEHRPGYNTVIVARARHDAELLGWTEIPFGMECWEAIEQTRRAAANLPAEAQRLVVPVGSGMSLAGILHGLSDLGRSLPVLGIVVGADPRKRLQRYAPARWRRMVDLQPAGVPYEHRAPSEWEGISLDPIYEAKCVPFLQAGDCFWIVGNRSYPDCPYCAPDEPCALCSA